MRTTMTVTALAMMLGWPAATWGQVKVGGNLPGGGTARVGTQAPENPADQLRDHAAKAIKQARAHVAAEQWYEARKALDRAGRTPDAAQRKTMRTLYVQINQAGQEEYEAAENLYIGGKYAEALKAYRSVMTVFGHLPSGLRARRALEAARDDPMAQSALGDARASKIIAPVELALKRRMDQLRKRRTAQAAQADTEAPETAPVPESRVEQIKLLDDEELAEVIEKLKLVAENYPNTPTGLLAEDDLRMLGEDEQFAARLQAIEARAEARKLYKTGQAFETGGLATQALEYYRKLLETHPDSDYAAQAAQAIGRIQAAPRRARPRAR
jgi:tetratricopeptide (TPR) repeat protein